MDVALDLVEAYLRLNGYLTLTELAVVAEDGHEGGYRSLTDVDVLALRLPGVVHPAGDADVGAGHPEVLAMQDEALALDPGCADVIVGEVKEAEAVLNPGLKEHRVLLAVLRRLEWLYDEDLAGVVARLQRDLITHSPCRGGGSIRTRLVAFGRSPVVDLNTMSIAHVVQTMVGVFEDLAEVFRPIHSAEPAAATIRLLLKSGFRLGRVTDDAVLPLGDPDA